jgi:hypothetical protein
LGGSKVIDVKVVSPNTNLPYGKIKLNCVGIEEDVIGFITHWIDFKNLWEIYKNRGVKEEEECLIYWTRNHYTKFMSKVLSFMMLKLVVMVCKKGTYESCPEGFGLENDRELMVNVYGLVIKCQDIVDKKRCHNIVEFVL